MKTKLVFFIYLIVGSMCFGAVNLPVAEAGEKVTPLNGILYTIESVYPDKCNGVTVMRISDEYMTTDGEKFIRVEYHNAQIQEWKDKYALLESIHEEYITRMNNRIDNILFQIIDILKNISKEAHRNRGGKHE